MSDLILYTTEDGKSQVKQRADQHTVWLTQLEMAELFDTTKQNILSRTLDLNCQGSLDSCKTRSTP